MTHVSLFAGIGGFDLAAEWAGFRTVAQVEIDPYCRRVLERHWPDVNRVSDIRNFPDKDYGAVTLVSGGPPCQPSSCAGKRRGRADDRWLWPEMLRVVRELFPRWVVAENPPGILTLENGLAIEAVLTELEDAGYEILPPVVYPACGVGAPHIRQRVFIVAHANKQHGNRAGHGASPLCGKRSKETQILGGPVSPDSAGERCKEGRELSSRPIYERSCATSSNASHSDSGGVREQSGRAIESRVFRGDDGLLYIMDGARQISALTSEKSPKGKAAGRTHRIRALGNAIIPQQAYSILKAIAEIEGRMREAMA